MAKIVGLSGSTVKFGVVEKAMQKVLESTGHEWEIVRLSELNMKYCTGCTGCVNTNRCVIKDDVNGILDKVEEADVVLLGGMARFGQLNALSKVFVERLSALFHNDVLENKFAASVAGGLFDQESVVDELSLIFRGYKMTEVGSLIVDGNASCYKCRKGETCSKSVFRAKFGNEAIITPEVFYRFDQDSKAVERAIHLGEKIKEALI